MPLDPGVENVLAFIEQAGHPPMHKGTPAEARKGFAALAAASVGPDGPVPVGSVKHRTIEETPARVYRPEASGPAPTILFFHGGGYVVGDIETHDNVCRRLCRDTGAVVVSIDYRLAPEHPFPAGVEDALAAAAHVASNLDEFGGTPILGVAGDSAGGNFSAVVAQHVPGITAQLLIYPAVDVFGDYASREANAEGYFLDWPTMVWFTHQYLADEVAQDDVRLSPLLGLASASLPVPPAVVVTAEFDPLRDEGRAYADALEARGVQVERVECDGLIHGFVDMGLFSEVAASAVTEMNTKFRDLLTR
ncbi:MAG: alpha/beta hydrolase [Nocardioides sp.]|nr:alpha/beta hydrolase [Nocardioides sp.]